MSIFQKGLFGGSSSGGGGGSGTGWDGRVNTFADLPSAATNTGKYYMVDTATGTHGVDRKEAGIYKSDGSSWTLCGTAPLTAVVIGGIVVAAAALGVFGSSTIKVTPDVVNGTMTIEGNYTGGTGINVTDNVVTATGNFGSENVYTTGNIGVGTTAPTQKLDVNGTVKAIELTGTTVVIPWEDRIPATVYAQGIVRPVISKTPYAISLEDLSCDQDIDPTTETNKNLKHADDCQGFANATVIVAMDSTAGKTRISGAGNFSTATIPAGKCVYEEYDAAPDSSVKYDACTLRGRR